MRQLIQSLSGMILGQLSGIDLVSHAATRGGYRHSVRPTEYSNQLMDYSTKPLRRLKYWISSQTRQTVRLDADLRCDWNIHSEIASSNRESAFVRVSPHWLLYFRIGYDLRRIRADVACRLVTSVWGFGN